MKKREALLSCGKDHPAQSIPETELPGPIPQHGAPGSMM
jgi:hypothetical protein